MKPFRMSKMADGCPSKIDHHIILIDALLTSNPSIASLINIFKNLKYIFEKSTN